jgi:chitosanase
MLTATQKKTAEAIVNVFETSEVLGRYGQVTLIAGDTGHLTYGRSQTTLSSGNLHTLLAMYCGNLGAVFGPRLAPFVPRMALPAPDLTLDDDGVLKNLLRAAADDPVMRDVQDAFFDLVYWQKAARAAALAGIVSPLGVAVVYDSIVHGSFNLIRQRTTAQVGTVAAAGEKVWVAAYVAARRQWLANHSRRDLRPTVYRPDAFRRLIDQDLWALELPLVVRGEEISAATLAAQPPGCYDGPLPGSRPLMLDTPIQRGLDVRRVQLGLSTAGHAILADGMWGRVSTRVLQDFQRARGLPATGVADVELVMELAAI